MNPVAPSQRPVIPNYRVEDELGRGCGRLQGPQQGDRPAGPGLADRLPERLLHRPAGRGVARPVGRAEERWRLLGALDLDPRPPRRMGLQVLDERGGVVSAHVTTARPLPEDRKNTVRETLAAATGRAVRVSFNIDETIIGGLVARIGSTIYDGSVQSRLDRLSEELAG